MVQKETHAALLPPAITKPEKTGSAVLASRSNSQISTPSAIGFGIVAKFPIFWTYLRLYLRGSVVSPAKIRFHQLFAGSSLSILSSPSTMT